MRISPAASTMGAAIGLFAQPVVAASRQRANLAGQASRAELEARLKEAEDPSKE